MEKHMDRRQRKTREAIFVAFTKLLAQKDFNQITVGEIIEKADIGRATFYAHFETKDFLLKELCEDLFCHLFDAANYTGAEHKHIFTCDESGSIFLHLLKHIQKNDHHIRTLLSSQNNELFLRYFRTDLERLIESQLYLFKSRKNAKIPDAFWKYHIVSVFTETLKWWIDTGMEESPETIADYFMEIV